MITQSQLKLILDYDPLTGEFQWRKNGKTAGWIHKTKNNCYIRINIGKNKYRAHRLAFLYMTGELPSLDVDHIDGNGTNNKWCNIRSASKILNRRNSKIQSNNTSGLNGVSWNKRLSKWEVRICKKNIGYTTNIFEAACMRFSMQNNTEYFTDRHGR